VIDSPGPILFAQERTGRDGRRFRMLKLRTMVPDAEERKAELWHLNVLPPPDFKIPNDPRITRVGRFLRATSLDELPQLLNVLRGDMSLVGPRPTSFAPDTYELWHTHRLDVAPGITGLWQIEGRGVTTFDERLRLDVQYIRRRSLLYDLQLLARTLPVVLRRSGR
jgi:lipopolysaccharide/colanic/teichoic acid biosynthesis glycosyltransferase